MRTLGALFLSGSHGGKLHPLAEKARHRTITIVYAARDTERNSAIVLKRILDARSRT